MSVGLNNFYNVVWIEVQKHKCKSTKPRVIPFLVSILIVGRVLATSNIQTQGVLGDSVTTIPTPGSEKRAGNTAVLDSTHREAGRWLNLQLCLTQTACSQVCNAMSCLISSLTIAILSQVILTETWKAGIISYFIDN